ncbi:hypothetical protein SDC9_83438 [bioreactor metagenome]|uniref:Uncharacterized protein n=1 Tax=bioreactor metagenome TaxID=1076179 RepID=A0A644Z7J2_9ZZZZ|nr:hypothetical protein [Erysipelotrichaceae bacterium]
MEKFREIIKRRLIIASIYNSILLLILIIEHQLGNRLTLPDFAVGFITGAMIGLEFIVIYFMWNYRRALDDEQKLRQLYIKENDEREQYIMNEISRHALDLIIGSLIISVVFTVFINQTIFFTNMLILLFVLIVKGSFKIYYHHKY